MASVKKLIELLTSREKRSALILFLLMFCVAVGEVLGVGSVLPLMTILADPDIIETNRYLAEIYAALDFKSREQFLVVLCSVFFIILMSSLALKTVGVWAQLRFSFLTSHRMSCRLVGGYLAQPYQWFLTRHSSALSATILAEVMQVVRQALRPALELISNGITALLLVVLLVAVDPVLALASAVTLGGAYTAVFFGIRRRILRTGNDRLVANRKRYRVIEEAFGGVKNVKLSGLEREYVDRFRQPSSVFARRQITGALLGEIPSLAMQAILFGGMLLVLIYLMLTSGGFQAALPHFALYAFAGYRLMPALQGAHRSVTHLGMSEAALDSLHTDFLAMGLPRDSESKEGLSPNDAHKKLELRSSIELRDVTFAYPGSDNAVVSDFSLSIKAGETIALVGPTGSGKTTTADIVLGLLVPQTGDILIDGQELDSVTRRQWQRNLGYVPQAIYLSDDSIAMNIALGIRESDIDMEAVERAARIADLHDFVVGELPEGYDTEVGERGVRLSGGQRQRIGIARALYRNPDVLVLDEATSALDNLTEGVVMDAVNKLGGHKTIIQIAHRLSTVRSCDRIYLLEDGKIVADGSFDDLVRSNDTFRRMAAVEN